MSNNFTFNIKVRKTSMVYTLLLFVLSLSVNGQVTKTYADQVVSESHVTNSANATAEAGAATLEASSGFLLGAGAYSGHLELKFSQPLSAGTTSYLHLDFEDDILNALLGGELGGALADILGTVLLGNHYFNVEARGVLPTNVLQASSQNGFSSDEMRLVIDEHGNYLLAITPNFAYDKIYVENKMPSLIGLGVKETMDVYGVYYTTGQRMCGEPFATSYSGSGGTIDVLDLGQNGVQNPAHAIDADPNTYSNLRLGLLSVAGSLSQTIYFDSPSQATDQAVVELQVDDPTLLSLNVADGIKIEAFLGSTLVATFDDWSLLDLDLLGLLSNSQRVKVPFAPGTSFDRVRVTISSLVELQLTKSVKVYGAYQVPATATLSVSEYHVCEGETASLTATSTLGNLRWYSDLTSDTPLFEGAADFVTPALIQDATYYVASAKAGCVTESARKPVNVFVHPQAVAPTVVEAVKYVNSGGSTVFEIQNPQNHIEYVWYDGANAVHTGTTFMVGNVTSNQSYEVKAKIGATCVSASKTTVSVNVTAALLPPEVSPTTITITEGENASFVATATPNSSVNFIWEDQNGDTLVVENAATGQMTFETGSSLTPGTYTYEVYTQSATETSTSVFVTITVVSANALDCYVANTQTSGVLPVCVLCEVDEAQNAVDGDINTASRFVAPASVIGGVWQELVFQQQGQSGDKVELIIGEENAVLNLTLLGGITFETYNGGTANGDAVTGNALVDVTLLSGGTKAKVVITAGGVFDRVRVTYRPLLGLLNNNFLLYKGNIDYQDPAIVTQNVSVCEGDTTTLTVTPASGYQAHWYAQEVGGTPLISNSVSYTTPALTTLGENTFYVALLYNGCEEANRLPVSVMVNKVPNAVDLRAEVEPVYCTGETVGIVPGLALGSSLNANDVTYDWYFDINKTQPISSGIVGGVDYFIDNLGMLAVNGLPASATPYTYYLSATNKNNCESEAGDLLEVSFKVLNTVPQVTVTGAGNPVCEGELVTLEASVAGINIDNPVYSWHQDINLADTPVLGDSIVVNANTTNTEYYVYVTGDNICPSAVESVSLTVNAVPEITLTKTSEIVALGNTIDLPAVTTIPNGLTPVWYDESGQVLPTTTGLSFSQTGVYTYVVAVEDAVTGCIATKEFTITVYDATACPTLTERVYADKQRWVTTLLGGVSNKNNAIDGNPKTYSTITTGLVLLGLGTTYQDLSWSNQTIAAGTPVSIKLGPEVGVLGLLNGISVVGRKNGQNIGAIKIVDMDLLNLINGENSYEYTFVPSNSSGPQDYDEVRIMVGGVLGIGNSVNVYGAYYRTPAGQVLDCQQGQVEDVFAGVDQVAALGALTGLTGVENPWDAVDNDMNTYAVMYNGVGVAAITQLTVDFKSASLEGDKIHIYLSNPNNILNLGLLSGFSIQRYLGTTKVGAPLDTAGGLLSLELLGLGSSTAKRLVVDPGDDLPYDRIRISNGGVVDVLDIIRIFEIKREPKISIQNGIENKLAICATDNIRISLQDDCTTYEVRDENDNLLTKLSEDTFELPSHVQENTTYTYKIQAYRYGCEYGSPQEIEVSITASALQTDLEPIQVNGANISGPLCLDQNESVVLTTALSDSSTITNPVYYWYDETGDSVVSADSSVLNLGVLTNGTYTYSVGVSGDGVCESTEANRREITFEIQVAATASDITVQDQAICYTDDAVITPTVSGIVNPQFNWYLANDTSQPILDGDTAGQVTYHISANGTLTVEGLSAGVTTSYYVSVQGDNFCENLPGTLAKATVVVSDVASPTATETTQTFCASDVPSIADIVVNESNVVWYDAASNGNQLGDTVLLADNTTYYASLTTAAGCESTSRLAITVSLTDPGLPTATETTQTFCASDAPSIADIVVNESNVIWYDGATNGTQLGDTTLLTDAATYYASLTTAAGCESTSRLAITVSLTDPGLPTATETTQTFCASDAPSIADIVVNENNVVWYDAASNGVQLGDTMLLADNTTYYASLTTAAGCESTSRLAITVSLTDPGLPTATETTQTFCASDMPSIADISVNESNVVWYDAASNGVQLGDTTLLADNTTYYASLTTTAGCESTSRLAITVSLTDPGLPTATETTQTFCASDAPSIADIVVNESNVVWYDAASNGVQLGDTTLLTDATTYYASLTTAAGCESTSRLAITVSLTDPGLPTATETTQTFCASDAPSIADIVVNESNVVWYDTATNGVQLGDTTLLTDNTTYYASLTTAAGCESTSRLAITVSLTDPGLPTATETTQTFCASDMPSIADISVNESNVVWYDAATNGVQLGDTVLLTDATTYYASLTTAAGCESTSRLAITVSLTDPGLPTATETTQTFCASDAPSIADIVVNESNVVWYDAATNGVQLGDSTLLSDNTTYYASLTTAEGCESTSRLAITVSLTDPGLPTATETTQTFCASDVPSIADISVNESNVVWYDAATNGVQLSDTTLLTDATTYYASLTTAAGCESTSRLAITVSLTDPGLPTATETTQTFCASDVPSIADIVVNESNVVWYDAATNGVQLGDTVLLTDATTYYASLTTAAGCESTSRLAITVSLADPGLPTATETTQTFCASDVPSIADIVVNENNVVWYDGATNGVQLGDTVLLTDATTYYASLTTAAGCESTSRLAITVSLTDPGLPTATETTQTFCASDMPSIADISVNESNVVWYDAASNGVQLGDTTLLSDNTIYYASLTTAAGCESTSRLAITVSLTDPGLPTATETTQTFCASDMPSIADISVNESNVVWYDAASNGVQLGDTTLLADATTYYASLTTAVGCESTSRLAITVSLTDPGLPTATETTQTFCASDVPSIADIVVNESNVVWYDAATNGVQLSDTTLLTDATTYYASLTTAAGCESTSRLAITVSLTDPGLPTATETTQTFCASDAPSIADIVVNENNVVWYDAASNGVQLGDSTLLADNTTYYASLTTAAGCESTSRLAITVMFYDPIVPSIQGEFTDVCVQTEYTYTADAGMLSYLWVIEEGQVIAGGGLDDDFVTVHWASITDEASVAVSYIDSNGCVGDTNLTTTIPVNVISCSDITITKTVDNPTPTAGEQVAFTITVTNNGQTAFEDVVVEEILPSGYVFIGASASIGTYNEITGEWIIPNLEAGETAVLTVNVKVAIDGDYLNIAKIISSTPEDADANNNIAEAEVAPLCLTVYNEFTPNNDGHNDYFEIDCIEKYPNNTLKVYNRFGTLVYETKAYDNTWDGRANKSSIGGDELPSGTYFYVLDINQGGIVKQGWLYIMR